MKAILIDDEVSCLETLEIELGLYCPEVEVLALCQSAKEGKEKIETLRPDVVFLDIEMPHMNGFDLLASFEEINFAVVFITAYDQYAIQAFDFSATDYLLKPVHKKKLIQTVEKISRQKDNHLNKSSLQLILDQMNTLSAPKLNPNIALPTGDGLEFVPVAEILYAEASGNYTSIHLASGRQILLSKVLKDVVAMLEGHPFSRIHQSYHINLEHIRKYYRGRGGYVVLSNGVQLSVSKMNRKRFLDDVSGR